MSNKSPGAAVATAVAAAAYGFAPLFCGGFGVFGFRVYGIWGFGIWGLRVGV